MFLVNLKKEMEILGGEGCVNIVIASVLTMMKDKSAPDETRKEMCFDDDGNLFVPDGINITEDSRFLINLNDESVILAENIEDEDGVECKCKKQSTKFYYAAVTEMEENHAGTPAFENFNIELLFMRDDPIAPQFVIGHAREGRYVIAIEREQFESLEIGDEIAVFMGEFYGTIRDLEEANEDDTDKSIPEPGFDEGFGDGEETSKPDCETEVEE